MTAGLVLAALVVTPASAEARTYVHQDARGDMVDMSVYPRDPKPDEAKGDIVRVRVRHGPRRIQLRVVFADLVKSPDIQYQTTVQLTTSKKVTRYVQVLSRPESWRGFARLYDAQATTIRCAIHRSHDFVHNVAVLGFSRRCLNSPRWIRVRIWTTTAVPWSSTRWACHRSSRTTPSAPPSGPRSRTRSHPASGGAESRRGTRTRCGLLLYRGRTGTRAKPGMTARDARCVIRNVRLRPQFV